MDFAFVVNLFLSSNHAMFHLRQYFKTTEGDLYITKPTFNFISQIEVLHVLPEL